MTITSALLAATIVAAPVPQPPREKPAAQMARTSERPPESAMATLQGFNIVLLIGESQSSGASIDDVPPAARRALNDMKDFLPFKHYRVLDSQWTSCCGNLASSRIAGRVQGLAAASGQGSETRLFPHTYEFLLQVMPVSSRLSVHFALSPLASRSARSGQNTSLSSAREAELEKRLSDLRKELDTLDDEIPRRAGTLNSKHPEVQNLEAQRKRVQQRIVETTNQLAGTSSRADSQRSSGGLIDSSFTMDLGETVVVGTSRLGGDKALIAIVTAVRKGAR